ncbi:MAG TPA: sortase [Patescibacteria group bacterium]
MRLSRRFFINIGISFWLLAVVFVLLPDWPYVYYRISPQTSETLASTIAYTVTSEPSTINEPSQKPTISPAITPTPTPVAALPDFDATLPEENGLIIDKIGVRGQIHEGDNWQEILKTGIWRVPNFSTPENPLPNRPIILAAHRWGYLDWSASFRKLNSFINLPQLTNNDEIQIIWNQRKYVYKIYSTNTGTQITDYSADLILYTCQLWNSPVRFFVYAQRTN